jgi:hypothetical protein
VAPTAKLAGEDGVIAMEDNVGTAITGKLTGGLLTPDITAVILAVPTATPAAKPVEDIVALVLLELAQVT